MLVFAANVDFGSLWPLVSVALGVFGENSSEISGIPKHNGVQVEKMGLRLDCRVWSLAALSLNVLSG